MRHGWRLDILYEDRHFLLVNKPAGMIVHPNGSEQSETLLNHVRSYLRRTGAWNAADPAAFRPQPCNRLDRFTGGIVIFAKTWDAMREMNRQLQTRAIEKRYLCIVIGTPRPRTGKLEHFILENWDGTRVSVLRRKTAGAKLAVTEYRTLVSHQGLSLVECSLVTGRMHQLRAQMAYCGTPILGDMTYGSKKENRRHGQEHQLLFAYQVTLHFPPDSETLAYLDGKTVSVKRVPFLAQYAPQFRLRTLLES